MPQVPVGALLVVALVATAGCNAPLADEPDPGETPTVTPLPVGERAAGATGSTDELAPGLGPEGVVDAERLLGAHAAVLANDSYTIRLSSRRVATDGSASTRHDRVVRVAGPERFHYALTTATDDGDRRVERWRDGEQAYEATTENGSTTYRSLEAPAPPVLLTRADLLRLFLFVPADVVDSRERNGTTVHTVAGGPDDLQPLSDVTYEAAITERGLVRSYEVRYDLSGRNPATTVTVTATVSDVGETTVERPSWVDDAT